MNNVTDLKQRETNVKINILVFISIFLLFISIANVNALIIGGRGEGYFEGTIDKVRIYNIVLTEEEVRQYYYSYFYKYYTDRWNFYSEQTKLTHGTYTYQGFAIDGAENENNTEMRTLIINNVPTHSTPIIRSTYGTNYTDEDLTCYNQSTYDADGDSVINIVKWYKNGEVQSSLENLFTITSENTLVGENWSCRIQPFDSIEYGITRSSNNLNVKCVDSDEDGVCDGDEPEECIGKNRDNVPKNETCIDYGFNSSNGCHIETIYVGKMYPEDCPEAFCYSPPQVNLTCNEDGGLYIPNNKNCWQMIQECRGDPDFNITMCANNFSKSEDEVICQEYEGECWSPYGPYYSGRGDGGCCGDNGIDECWIDGNENGCCYYEILGKVVYLTDPDDAMGYCLLLGQNKTGVSAGNCEDGERYCWDSDSQKCCGDDQDETWEYSTSYYIRDVLVNESCYNGTWAVVKERETTYFDLVSWILDIFE